MWIKRGIMATLSVVFATLVLFISSVFIAVGAFVFLFMCFYTYMDDKC